MGEFPGRRSPKLATSLRACFFKIFRRLRRALVFFPNETSFWETPLRIKEKASDRWENWISGPNPAAVSWRGGCFFPGEKISATDFGIICRNYLPISFWARVGSGQMISANNSEIICRNLFPRTRAQKLILSSIKSGPASSLFMKIFWRLRRALFFSKFCRRLRRDLVCF